MLAAPEQFLRASKGHGRQLKHPYAQRYAAVGALSDTEAADGGWKETN